ncbi:recognition complex subunit 1 [Tuber brumale]|nr:recognition complex subunit 1 [Tuber brumale]
MDSWERVEEIHCYYPQEKPLLLTPLSTRTPSPGTHLSTPYALARHRLHLSTLPQSLPWTRKKATVREVIPHLRYLVTLEELDDFTFDEINGIKVITGDLVSLSHASVLLESDLSTPSPRRVPCVALMEELDLLVTRGQGVSLTRMKFPSYTHSQPMTIIQSHLSSVPGNIVGPDSIQFASRKIATMRAVEIVQYSSNKEVTIAVVKQAIQEAPSSLQMFLKTTSLSSKIFIMALLLRSSRSRSVKAETIVRMQGVTEEELRGGPRFSGIEAAVKGLVESGLLSAEKRGGGGGRVIHLEFSHEEKQSKRKKETALRNPGI